MGLVSGSMSGAFGYRRELRGQASRRTVARAGVARGRHHRERAAAHASQLGVRDVVPVLILVACALVVLQPRLSALDRRAGARSRSSTAGVLLWVCIFATGIYGGYFGAAQGVILLALLGIFIVDDLQRLNGVKNVLALIANGVAAVVFVFAAHVVWEVAALIAVGSVVGGQIGAHVGRRMPAPLLRGVIVVASGLIAADQAARSDDDERSAARDDGEHGRRPPARAHESSTTQSPKRTYGVSPVVVVIRPSHDRLLEQARCVSRTLPSASITAVMPETDACSTGRPVSAARIGCSARGAARSCRPPVRAVVGAHHDRLGAVAHGVARRAARTPTRSRSRCRSPCPPTSKTRRSCARLEVVRDLAQLADEAERVRATARTRRTARGAASRTCPAARPSGSYRRFAL